MPLQLRDLLDFSPFQRAEFLQLIDHAIRLKEQTKSGVCPKPFQGKTVALIFHKPSLRTRISFEVGVTQLGGTGYFITDKEIELGKRESIADVARVLSGYVDLIVIRTFKQSDIAELAEWAYAPVINALTDHLHPCQVFCDLMTIKEKLGTVEGLKVTYLGDGNNMTRSWIEAARLLDIDLWVGTRSETHPGQAFIDSIMKNGCGKVTITDDPVKAVKAADVVYTDVWASMGEKDKADERARLLAQYQINSALMAHAKPECLVMHCLPAERGKEITDEVIDSPNSVVFDEAENRLHGQKTLMMWCMGAI
jgi:ornithine carbamoyltransferase